MVDWVAVSAFKASLKSQVGRLFRVKKISEPAQPLFLPFDLKFYRYWYPDLRELSDNQLVEHWNTFGQTEGRRGVRPQARGLERGVLIVEELEAETDRREAERRANPAAKLPALSIIIKVRNEPEMLGAWLDYHGELFGFENILVLDNDSDNPAHWEVLQHYLDKVLVISKGGFYDGFHDPLLNPEAFRWAAVNSKYAVFLDVDEYLVHRVGDELSGAGVAPFLDTCPQKAYAGTWLWNTAPLASENLDMDSPIELRVPPPGQIRSGAVAGKAIIPSSALPQVAFLCHNLHGLSTIIQMDAESFGQLFVIHLQLLNPGLVRRRAQIHLESRGVLEKGLSQSAALELVQARIDSGAPLPDIGDERYAHQFVAGKVTYWDASFYEEQTPYTVTINQLKTGITLPGLEQALEAFDFPALYSEWRTIAEESE